MERMNTPDGGRHIFGRPIGLALIVFYKTLWGLIEIGAGIVLVYSSTLIAQELVEDPQDTFVNWLFTLFGQIHLGALRPFDLGLIIALFGLGKLAVAACLWHRQYWIRDFGLVLFSVTGVIGLYALTRHVTLVRSLALLIDLLSLYYFWKILPHHLHHHEIS